ncbi:MAG: hypothetical protein RMY36_013995 [Nostoc sp. SerVER01]
MVRVNCREYNRDSGGDGGNYPISGEWGVGSVGRNNQCPMPSDRSVCNT